MSITRTCRISWKEFTITDQEIALLNKLSPIIGWEKFALPLPTLCPEERRRRKLPYKNYFSLFRRTDAETGEKFISTYPPDSSYTVYSQPHWWSDSWEGKDYAKEYTREKSVFEQIHELQLSVPLPALDNSYRDLENSEYINGNGKSKNCYLISNGNNNEKCLYSWYIFGSSNVIDSNYITECEYCSHSQHLWKCYDVHHSWDTSECRESRYCFSCIWCHHILGWVGLTNQSYQILNISCTKEEFETTLEKLKKDAHFRRDFESKTRELIGRIWLKRNILTGSIDTTGDFCYDSKNAYECYNVGDCENVFYITDSYDTKDSMDISMWGDNTRLSYDCIDIGLNVSNLYWSTACWDGAVYNFYSYKCHACSYVFGCVWLKNQSYCILNKQYTKEEWEETIKKMIRQMQKEETWGEFLDPRYAFYAYNESHAMEQLPLAKEEVTARWFRWSDRAESIPEGITKMIPGGRLPESIEWIPDDVLDWAIQCRITGKYFKIQPLELDMLRRFSLPLPQIHPIERIQKRFLWDRRDFSFDF